ncbi:hypothetical protein [Paracoccus laeviglucosivorans]|uniref:Uncharacterized protein n=1 Tax=Paracoccus laeviglucosivorans TaxID=1197861 RepID=A0A521FNP9_9RHOB|nr:hypothetical protein [Paracoccus laeviglucosivorans]SMO97827.1 hypothetical protein SAMN06265221_1313 [Paracoccus laeviglucosivorans]
MTTIFDAAMRNFRAAADILEALQATRLDLVNEARTGLIGRPKLGLAGGYNNITASFGACLPTSARADVLMAEDNGGIELRCSGADWMTLEGTLPADMPAEHCYMEMQVSSDRPVVVDVFVREFLEDGSVRDAGHRECQLVQNSVTVCNLRLPETTGDAVGRRVIVHLRQPAQRMIIDRLAVTLT